MSDAPSPRPPFAAAALDGSVVAFATLTLVVHATVGLGGSLDDALVASAVVAAIAAGAAALALHRARGRGTQSGRAGSGAAFAPALAAAPAAAPPPRALRLGVLGAAALASGAGAVTGSIVVWWAIAAGALLVALPGAVRSAPALHPPLRSPVADGLPIALGLVCAAAVAIAHRADADDSFYVNLVVFAAGHPDAPLLAGDTLHGYPGVAMSLPVFKVLSWEILQAGLARLTGLAPITIAHVVVPPIAALLVPLAWARLAARLLPTVWPVALAFAVLALFAVGDGAAGHGDFALLRLQQGKSVMLHVALPLCTAYAIEFAARPSPGRFVRLAAAQIAAVGLSASGLWLGPVCAGLGLLAATPADLADPARRLRALGLGLAASLYPVVLALALRAATLQAMQDAPHPLEGASWDGPRLMTHAADRVLGDGAYRAVALFALLAASVSAADGLLRRYAAIAAGVFVALLFDPLTAPAVATGITGADTYFRVFWVLPVPLLVAGLLVEPLSMRDPGPRRAPGPATGRRARLAATGALAIAVLVLAPGTPTLSAANDVRLAPPGPRIPPDEWAAVRTVAAHADADAFVLAPRSIARWIPLVEAHPRPLMVRELYIDRLDALLGTPELDRRRVLAHLVGGAVRPRGGGALLARAIDDYPLAVVVLEGPALGWPELRGALLESPLEVVARRADREIWARP